MDTTVAVIGTTFIDCKGFSRQEYSPLGRNLGNIQFVHGGVGRNVAENLALLDVPTFFVSSVDKSALGGEVAARLKKSRVDLEFLAYSDCCGMGMWLAILDQSGNLAGSVSQMPDLDILEKIIEEKGHDIMEAAGHIVLELDLNSRISRRVAGMAREYGKKLYGIPGNLEVILKNPDLLTYTDCFICNDIEAGKIFRTGLGGMDEKDLLREVVRFVSGAGIPSMVVTLGERGAVFYDSRTAETGYQPAFPTSLADSSGAGDAFFSGAVMGLVNNRPLGEAVVYGTKIASWTIQVEENNCLDLPFRLREEKLFRNMLSAGGSGLNLVAG
ncbi:MAG: PfkB family carbohydrate kinase [Actinobacteria bacterium]|nr:PfkB family carbohydrate kinase [Actinomycetota bacterium]